MCDCYETNCTRNCGATIKVHIGDWSTCRENVKVYCPECCREVEITENPVRISLDEVTRPDQIRKDGVNWGRRGDYVLFIIIGHDGYNIHLN